MNSSDHLRDSEQGFPLIVGSIPGLVCTMTAGGGVEFVNQQILDYTGKPVEELRDWGPLVHPDDLALVMTRWMRSIEAGMYTMFILKLKLICADARGGPPPTKD